MHDGWSVGSLLCARDYQRAVHKLDHFDRAHQVLIMEQQSRQYEYCMKALDSSS